MPLRYATEQRQPGSHEPLDRDAVLQKWNQRDLGVLTVAAISSWAGRLLAQSDGIVVDGSLVPTLS